MAFHHGIQWLHIRAFAVAYVVVVAADAVAVSQTKLRNNVQTKQQWQRNEMEKNETGQTNNHVKFQRVQILLLQTKGSASRVNAIQRRLCLSSRYSFSSSDKTPFIQVHRFLLFLSLSSHPLLFSDPMNESVQVWCFGLLLCRLCFFFLSFERMW